MADRAIIKTTIAFGLVSIGVKLTTCQGRNPIEFHNLCPTCHSRLNYKRWCPKCDREVAYRDMLKGYQISKSSGTFVCSQEEVKRLKDYEKAKGIEILGFIPSDDLPFYLLDKTYNLLPLDDGFKKPFVLFREALSLSNLCAFGRFVMRSNEYLCLIRAYRDRLFLTTLIFPHRVGIAEKVESEVSEAELNLGLKLIEAMATTFNELHTKGLTADKYLENFRGLLAGKVKLKPIGERVAEAQSLLEQLKKSVEVVSK